MSHLSRYVVTGMTCAHCVQAVTEEVGGLPGVSDVTVELATGALTVVSDDDLPVDEVERAVDQAGYALAAR